MILANEPINSKMGYNVNAWKYAAGKYYPEALFFHLSQTWFVPFDAQNSINNTHRNDTNNNKN